MTGLRLIGVGLGHYAGEPDWALEQAQDSRRRVEELFGRHGAVAEDWTAQAYWATIAPCLDRWAESSEHSSIIYWVGHGDYSDDGYRAALADSTGPLRATNALTDEVLTHVLRDQHRRRIADGSDGWVLLILDTCGSGPGAWRLWRSFEDNPPANVGVIAAAASGAANVGRLPGYLERVLHGFDGNDSAGIPLREVMRRLEDLLEDGLRHKQVYSAFGPSAYLPHPAGTPAGVMAPVDVSREMNKILDAAPPQVRNHYYAKARGGEIGDPAWHFIGRTDERRRISAWLRDDTDGMFVVTGAPGSGKSALLGMLLATSDDTVTAAITATGYGRVPEELRPVGVRFDAVLHLSGRTAAEVVTALAEAIGEDAATLFRAPESDTRRTIIVDALDESRDPHSVALVLRRVARRGGTKVLVGTRQSIHDLPDIPPSDTDVIDALGADSGNFLVLEQDPAAVRRYVRTRLRRSGIPEPEVDCFVELAELIGGYRQPFLFARLAVHEILARPELLTAAEQSTAILDSGHRGLFRHAVARLAATAPKVEVLLRALARARGNGFPRTGGIWARVASALGPEPIGDTDIETALALAAPYIMQDTEFGVTVYRLAHRTFVEWYRAEADCETSAEQHIARALLGCGSAAVDRAEPVDGYLRRYLAEHVGVAGLWRELGERVGLLDRLDPTAVATEAFRTESFSGVGLPATIVTTMVAQGPLAGTRTDRNLVRALTATRLGLRDPLVRDDRVRWSHLAGSMPHISLTTTGWVNVMASGRLADGRSVVACGDYDGVVHLWDMSAEVVAGGPVYTPVSEVRALAFGALSDGRVIVASGGKHAMTCLWDTKTGELVDMLVPDEARASTSFRYVSALAFDRLPSGHALMAAGGDNGVLRLWDAETKKVLVERRAHDGVVRAAAFGHFGDGRTILATGGADGAVRLWSIGDRRGGKQFIAHEGGVGDLAFGRLTDDTVVLATAGGDGIRLWDPSAQTDVPIRFIAHAAGSTGVAFGRLTDGRVVVAAGSDRAVQVWDVADGSQVCPPLAGHTHWVTAVEFGVRDDGRTVLASGGFDRTVRLWEPGPAVRPADREQNLVGEVRSLAFGRLADGRARLVSGGRDGVVRLWEPVTGTPTGHPMAAHPHGAAVAFGRTATGQVVVASGGSDGMVRLWDPATGAAVGRPWKLGCAVRTMAIGSLEDGRTVLAAGGSTSYHEDKGYVRVWDMATGRTLGEPLAADRDGIRTVAWGPTTSGGAVLAVGVADGAIRLWDPAHGVVAELPTGHRSTAHVLAFGRLRDGRQVLASGDIDGTVQLWDLAAEVAIGEPRVGHGGPVNALVFWPTPAEATMLISGDDDTVRLWPLEVARTPRVLPLASQCVALVADPPALYIGCADGLLALDLTTMISASS
ncbi:hypothetical protein [Nocardia carnea]|nr:hypothetical protein [Nocardia carnea]